MSLLAIDQSKLNTPSRNLLHDLMVTHPNWGQYFRMERSGTGYDLYVEVPSPTGDRNRCLVIWFEEEEEDVYVAYGGWQGNGWEIPLPSAKPMGRTVSLIDFIKMVVANRLCLLVETRSNGRPRTSLIDMEAAGTKPEELAEKKVTAATEVKSWDGSLDQSLPTA